MTFPRAEKFAREMPLPMAVDPVVMELYQYAAPVLDEGKARRALAVAGFRGEALEAGLGIVRERAERAMVH